MGIVKADEITGYHFESGEVVCPKCATDEDDNEVKENEILRERETSGDDRYYCDRCHERL